MKKFILILLLCSTLGLRAQVSTSVLSRNAQIENFRAEHPTYEWNHSSYLNKWGLVDTLNIPFFDDFHYEGVYPDSSKWLNNQVYVNRHFADEPPTLGVATFDVLDAQGTPYNNGTLNKDFSGPGDSLISMPINLSDSAGVAYHISDSFFLSFFYQPNGLGYHLEAEDSLRLFFKNKFNVWVQVWSVGGNPSSKPFEQVILPIDQSGYFHKGFQFMFTTWTRQVGNANHWHVDYIYLDRYRSQSREYFEDYAVQSRPTSLLKDYYEMPLSHFLANPSAALDDSIYFWGSNLDQIDLNMQVSHRMEYEGRILVSTLPGANAVNLKSMNNDRRRFEMFPFQDSLSGTAPAVIERIVKMAEAGVINKNTDNDTIHTQQIFHDHFARDDGSAEQGFGFDQDINPRNIEGEIAYRFTLNHSDTLFAITTFFNQAVFDVSREVFTFRVWQSIDQSGQGGQDSLLYESEPLNPKYMEKINQFSVHYLDTLLVLPAGDFYIGWYQSSMYNLNVGWDRNAGTHKEHERPSSHLFYKVFGSWSNNNLPNGELMMRPYVGSSRELFVHVPERQLEKSSFNPYPNPAHDHLNLGAAYQEVILYSITGEMVFTGENCTEISLKGIPNGIYMVMARNSSNQWLRTKLTKFAP